MKINPHEMNEVSGARRPNGTWTGALGLLHTGIVDIWTAGAPVALDKSEAFRFTTPFLIEKYGVLIKRQDTFAIHLNHITAGIDLHLYGFMFAIFALLFIVSCINERFQHSNERNFTWHLLLSLFPMDGQMWPNQTGVTRKVLMATCGFAILILSSLYQAKLSEKLLIPDAPPAVTLPDIEHYVSSGQAKLLFQFANNPTMQYVSAMSSAINSSIYKTTPLYRNDADMLYEIMHNNAVVFGPEGVLYSLLNRLDGSECANYVLITLDTWTRIYLALIMSQQRRNILENMNAIVAQRMNYVGETIQAFQFSDECRKHIFPVYEPNPSYVPLKLSAFTDTFSLLFLFLFFSILVLVGERMWGRKQHKERVVQSIEYHLQVSMSVSPDIRNELHLKWMEILKLLDKLDNDAALY
jgi:hypothetical protein